MGTNWSRTAVLLELLLKYYKLISLRYACTYRHNLQRSERQMTTFLRPPSNSPKRRTRNYPTLYGYWYCLLLNIKKSNTFGRTYDTTPFLKAALLTGFARAKTNTIKCSPTLAHIQWPRISPLIIPNSTAIVVVIQRTEVLVICRKEVLSIFQKNITVYVTSGKLLLGYHFEGIKASNLDHTTRKFLPAFQLLHR